MSRQSGGLSDVPGAVSPAPSSVSIVIAEDDALLRSLLAQVLSTHKGFSVVGSAASGQEALDRVAELDPDVLLLDLNLPGISGHRVVEELSASPDAPIILVMSGEEDEDTQLEVARHGAHGFVPKSQGMSVLPAAIRAVAGGGEVWYTRKIVGRIFQDYARLSRQERHEQRPTSRLSEREREVLARVAAGMTNQQIGEELNVSVSTVKVYIRNIFQRFDLPNRTEAAVFALKQGLLEPNGDRLPR